MTKISNGPKPDVAPTSEGGRPAGLGFDHELTRSLIDTIHDVKNRSHVLSTQTAVAEMKDSVSESSSRAQASGDSKKKPKPKVEAEGKIDKGKLKLKLQLKLKPETAPQPVPVAPLRHGVGPGAGPGGGPGAGAAAPAASVGTPRGPQGSE